MGLSTLLYALPPLSKELGKVEKGLRGTYLDIYIQGIVEIFCHGLFLFVMVYSIMETQTMIAFAYSQRPHDMDMSFYNLLTHDAYRYFAYYFIYINITQISKSLSLLSGGRDIP